MSQREDIPWERINSFVLSCGEIHEPYRFCVNALQSIGDLIEFDEGVVLMLDGNRNIVRKYFYNIPRRWSTVYLEWYSHSRNSDFSLYNDYADDDSEGPVKLIQWDRYEWWGDDELEEYIKGRGIKTSLAFTLFDLHDNPATSISLDRVTDRRFSTSEVRTLRIIAAHLNNLYKNLFVRPAGQVRLWDGIPGGDTLTTREREVLDLLCEGFTPSSIARDLHISLGTTNKHIGHIYQKIGVNNRQELLVRLLGK